MSSHLHEHGAVVRARAVLPQPWGLRRQVSPHSLYGGLVVLPYARAADLLERGFVKLAAGATRGDLARAAERYGAETAEAHA